jgi:flagellar biosynthesis chaperone FliJ
MANLRDIEEKVAQLIRDREAFSQQVQQRIQVVKEAILILEAQTARDDLIIEGMIQDLAKLRIQKERMRDVLGKKREEVYADD